MKKLIIFTFIALLSSISFAATNTPLRCKTTTKLTSTKHCAQMLYALIAEHGEITKNKNSDTYTLMLTQTSKMLTYFSDRPVRISGVTHLFNLIKFWNIGDDSFAKIPPNAAIETFSATQNGEMAMTHYVLEISHPKLNMQKNELSFTVKSLGKTILSNHPITLEHVALFIDPRWGGNLG